MSPRQRICGPFRISVPTRGDALLRQLNEVVGGPMGSRSAPGLVRPGYFTVPRVLILMTTTAALVGLLLKTPCRVGGWTPPEQFYMTCYSDWTELFLSRGLGWGAFPLIDRSMLFEYPVLLAVLAGVTSLLVAPAQATGLGDQARAAQYFDVNATLLAGVWIITVLVTMRLANRRPWDAAMVAVAPGIIFAGTINWDLWAVMLTALGMLAFARHRPLLAGVIFGLGTAVKVYPLLLLGAILVLAVRTKMVRPFVLAASGLIATWAVVDIPFMLHDLDAWKYFLDFTQDREAGLSSVWFVYNAVAGPLALPLLDPATINTLGLLLFILACGAILVLGLAAERRPRLAQLAVLIVGAFILTNKVYSPQFVLWLIPLVALAVPRWRTYVLWQLLEVLHWWAVWMYLGAQTGGGATEHNIDETYYVFAVIGHILGTLYVMVAVVMDIFHPRSDPVRRLGIDDPQGGPFDHAPDRYTLRPQTVDEEQLGRTSGPTGVEEAPRAARVGLAQSRPPVKDPP